MRRKKRSSCPKSLTQCLVVERQRDAISISQFVSSLTHPIFILIKQFFHLSVLDIVLTSIERFRSLSVAFAFCQTLATTACLTAKHSSSHRPTRRRLILNIRPIFSPPSRIKSSTVTRVHKILAIGSPPALPATQNRK